MNNTKSIVNTIKGQEEDYELYPTTHKMVKVVRDDIIKYYDGIKSCSILDIGAGNGNFFNTFEDLIKDDNFNITKYAIEKSQTLIASMDPSIYIIGTDFHQQTLIDKKVDVIFCNPPYSEYEAWSERIITQANSRLVYLIIPERWKDSKVLQDIIRKRGIEYEIIKESDFLYSEFRPSRAKVNIIRFSYGVISRHNDTINSDPFDIWFDNFFSIDQTEQISKQEETEIRKEKIRCELVGGQNLIELLEKLYRKDLDKLLNNYRMIEQLDYNILWEIGVNCDSLKKGLKIKIEGLKNLYWQELFDNFDTITSRLTTQSRKNLLEKLTRHTSIDFNADNAYAVVIWAIKNVNLYIDKQLKEVYLWMSDKNNIKNYKSNHVMIDDTWRYNVSNHSHYALDYRLVLSGYNNFNRYKYGICSHDFPMGLSRTTHERINDIITIAKNLGFSVYENSMSFEWSPGKAFEFTGPGGTLVCTPKTGMTKKTCFRRITL